jgi:hypothetical protein
MAEIAVVHGGRALRANALLDTGANVTLFPTGLADALGIDWQNAPTTPVLGVGGRITGHVVTVRVELCDTRYDWEAPIVFAPGAIPTPLLGHRGFFEHFEVRFKTAQRQFRIYLK